MYKYKRFIVDSRWRNDNDTNSEYTIEFTEPLKTVHSVSLLRFTYDFSKREKIFNDVLKLFQTEWFEIDIDTIRYTNPTISSLCVEIQNKMPPNFSVSSVNNRIRIASNDPFEIDVHTNNLSKRLGLEKTIHNSEVINGEHVINGSYDMNLSYDYVFMKIKYPRADNMITPNDVDIQSVFAMLPLNESESIRYEKKWMPPIKTIFKMEFNFIDSDNILYDFGNAEHIFELIFEMDKCQSN